MDQSEFDMLIERYAWSGATLAEAERVANGYAMTTDDSQPVDDDTLSHDIDTMRAALADPRVRNALADPEEPTNETS